ncbi:hypothetical protein MPTK1_4g06260 [Marchantia polymorpha subsp. ruderalis]|uniref:Uncharacterized protein n=2 Tax=Marchantia polymorpha TaxID=3197 RepID=A0AAF6B6Y1_MARPO|nr:hypothetical protein MARPO_0114s0027 [Marchantia polymorpha]BBN07765.1 hypothetical protein Mp_4g06260 [Marchantia polymorpha subsp. ruderalis]|eukprot:PTQ31207.1 hypothetical protein MARPO_0114s0027 [Marchantia polymorpha]
MRSVRNSKWLKHDPNGEGMHVELECSGAMKIFHPYATARTPIPTHESDEAFSSANVRKSRKDLARVFIRPHNSQPLLNARRKRMSIPDCERQVGSVIANPIDESIEQSRGRERGPASIHVLRPMARAFITAHSPFGFIVRIQGPRTEKQSLSCRRRRRRGAYSSRFGFEAVFLRARLLLALLRATSLDPSTSRRPPRPHLRAALIIDLRPSSFVLAEWSIRHRLSSTHSPTPCSRHGCDKGSPLRRPAPDLSVARLIHHCGSARLDIFPDHTFQAARGCCFITSSRDAWPTRFPVQFGSLRSPSPELGSWPTRL